MRLEIRTLRELHSALVADERAAPTAATESRLRSARKGGGAGGRRRLDLPSSADLRFALDAVGRWHEAETRSGLAAMALRDLCRLVPCDGIGWNDVDLDASEVRLVVWPDDYDAGPPETLNRLIGQNPIVAHAQRTGDRGTVK